MVTEEKLDKVFPVMGDAMAKPGCGRPGKMPVVRGDGLDKRRGSQAVVAGLLDHSTSNTRLEARAFCHRRAVAGDGHHFPRRDLNWLRETLLKRLPFWLAHGSGTLRHRLSDMAEAVTGTPCQGREALKPAEERAAQSASFSTGKETFDDVVACATETRVFAAGRRVFANGPD